MAGLGIVVMPTFFISREIEQGTLVPLLEDIEFTAIDAWAIYPRTRHLSRRVRAFIDFLAERFAASTPWDDRP